MVIVNKANADPVDKVLIARSKNAIGYIQSRNADDSVKVVLH